MKCFNDRSIGVEAARLYVDAEVESALGEGLYVQEVAGLDASESNVVAADECGQALVAADDDFTDTLRRLPVATILGDVGQYFSAARRGVAYRLVARVEW